MPQALNVSRTEDRVIFTLTHPFLNGSDQSEFSCQITDEEIDGGAVVALDMSKVNAVNSLGVGKVLTFYARVRKLGSHFLMINASERVERVFKTCGIIPTCFINKPATSLADLET